MRHRPLLAVVALSFPAAALLFACTNDNPAVPAFVLPDGSLGPDGEVLTPPDGSTGPGDDGSTGPGDGSTGPGNDGSTGPGDDGSTGDSGFAGPFLYVPPNGGLDTWVFRVDPVTGALSGGMGAGPNGKTAGERTALAHPNGKFYFSIDATPGNLNGRIDVYRIDGATGMLSPVRDGDGGAYSFVLPNADFHWMVTDPKGKFLYVTDGYAGNSCGPICGNSQIVTLAFNEATGALSLAGTVPMNPFAFESGPDGLALDPDAGCLYSAGYNFPIARLKLDPNGIPRSVDAGGVIGVGDAGQSLGECTQVVVGANGTAYGICQANAGLPGKGLYAYSFNGGTLSIQKTTANTKYFNPIALAAHPNGKFVYVVTTDGSIVTFGVPAGGGVPTQVAASAGGLPVTSLQFDHTGAHLYAGGGNSPAHIHLFNVNPATGALTLADPTDGGVTAGPFGTSNLVLVP